MVLENDEFKWLAPFRYIWGILEDIFLCLYIDKIFELLLSRNCHLFFGSILNVGMC